MPIWICAAAIGLACLTQCLLRSFRGAQFFQRLEWIAYDWRMQTAHHFQPPVSDKLGFVCIGDDAISLFSHGTLGTNFLFGLKWPRHI